MDDLIAEAKIVLDQLKDDNHKVACIMRSVDGQLFKGVSVQGQKIHLCSEWSALTQALMAKADIKIVVAVRKKDGEYFVYPPCGLCREFLLTYYPDAEVAVSEGETLVASSLLPNAWKKS
ncbi:MAG: hypothetical protein AAB413_02175 [Patescibacteria group bacterium]